jgi:hypothetical protein
VGLLENLLIVAVGGLVIWGVWRAAQPRCAFVILVRAGEPVIASGAVTAAFLQQLREVVATYGIQTAKVSGVVHGRRIALQFSRQIPGSACQRLRNWWCISC